jgi:SPFH domain / Band 7 family
MANLTNVTEGRKRRRGSMDPPRFNIISLLLLLAGIGLGSGIAVLWDHPWAVVVGSILGCVAGVSPRIAQQWERAVVLRLGKYTGLRGPGLFWIIPGIDQVSSWIDQRTITTSFAAEQTLTADTVPVNVDAVLFWMVYDPEKAALEVQDYQVAVSWAAQTALRDIIGRTPLTILLRGREQIEAELQKLIDARSNPWGVTVQSVEMRDVVIPESLQDAMSLARTSQSMSPSGSSSPGEVPDGHARRDGRAGHCGLALVRSWGVLAGMVRRYVVPDWSYDPHTLGDDPV